MSRTGFGIAVAALSLVGYWVIHVQGADEAKTSKTPSADGKTAKELHIKYAQTYAKLIELDLTRFREMNRRTPGIIPADVIRPLEQAAQVSQLWLKEVVDADDGHPMKNIFVHVAEIKEKLAHDEYQRFVKGNERNPNVITAQEVERQKLHWELASLRLARARALDVNSPTDVLHFEIGQVREDVLELQVQLAEQAAKR